MDKSNEIKMKKANVIKKVDKNNTLAIQRFLEQGYQQLDANGKVINTEFDKKLEAYKESFIIKLIDPISDLTTLEAIEKLANAHELDLKSKNKNEKLLELIKFLVN